MFFKKSKKNDENTKQSQLQFKFLLSNFKFIIKFYYKIYKIYFILFVIGIPLFWYLIMETNYLFSSFIAMLFYYYILTYLAGPLSEKDKQLLEKKFNEWKKKHELL